VDVKADHEPAPGVYRPFRVKSSQERSFESLSGPAHGNLDLQGQLVSARNALAVRATHDSLTGLSNRAAVQNTLRTELVCAIPEGTQVGIKMADLDYFNQVNDSNGHPARDAVLREGVRRMSASVRPYRYRRAVWWGGVSDGLPGRRTPRQSRPWLKGFSARSRRSPFMRQKDDPNHHEPQGYIGHKCVSTGNRAAAECCGTRHSIRPSGPTPTALKWFCLRPAGSQAITTNFSPSRQEN
jgi:hypothetical protein